MAVALFPGCRNDQRNIIFFTFLLPYHYSHVYTPASISSTVLISQYQCSGQTSGIGIPDRLKFATYPWSSPPHLAHAGCGGFGPGSPQPRPLRTHLRPGPRRRGEHASSPPAAAPPARPRHPRRYSRRCLPRTAQWPQRPASSGQRRGRCPHLRPAGPGPATATASAQGAWLHEARSYFQPVSLAARVRWCRRLCFCRYGGGSAR